MPRTLVVDDEVTLVRSLQERGEKRGVKDVEFFTSLGAARGAAKTVDFDRYIADQSFEGEEDDGLAFLEDMKKRRREAEVILLTGQRVTGNVETRLNALGGRLIKKQDLTYGLVDNLLGGRELALDAFAGFKDVESTDVGELRLEVEALKNEIERLRAINDLLVEDVISELKELPEQDRPAMLVGDMMFSPEDLRYEVENRTEIGREIVRLHHELNKMMRDR